VSELLTPLERQAVQQFADAWNTLCHVVGNGSTRERDLAEAAVHLHALQQMVLAQAAARAYPDLYRLAGETVRTDNPPRPIVRPALVLEPCRTTAERFSDGATLTCDLAVHRDLFNHHDPTHGYWSVKGLEQTSPGTPYE
jgi:hypothetical protein